MTIFSEMYCENCGAILYYRLDEDFREIGDLICLKCSNIAPLSPSKARDILSDMERDNEREIETELDGKNWDRLVIALAAIREHDADTVDPERSDITVISQEHFTQGTISLSILYQILSKKNYTGFDSEGDIPQCFNQIMKLAFIKEFRSAIESDLGCLAIQDDDYVFYNSAQKRAYADSLKSWGLGDSSTDRGPDYDLVYFRDDYGDHAENVPLWYPRVLSCQLYMLLSHITRNSISFPFQGIGNKQQTLLLQQWTHGIITLFRKEVLAQMEKDQLNPSLVGLPLAIFTIPEFDEAFNRVETELCKKWNASAVGGQCAEIIRNKLILKMGNSIDFPVFVQTPRYVCIGMKTLENCQYLLEDVIENDKINGYFSNSAMKMFNERAIHIITDNGINLIDDSESANELMEIKTGKNGKDFDAIGRDEDTLYVFEFKSFHPAPHFDSKKDRKNRFQNRYQKFQKKVVEDTIPFFQNIFQSTSNLKDGLREILMYYADLASKPGPVLIKLAENFMPQYIASIFVNEIKEYAPDLKNITIINISELDESLKNKIYVKIPLI